MCLTLELISILNFGIICNRKQMMIDRGTGKIIISEAIFCCEIQPIIRYKYYYMPRFSAKTCPFFSIKIFDDKCLFTQRKRKKGITCNYIFVTFLE